MASTRRRVKCQPPTANWHESSKLLLFGVERRWNPDVDTLVSTSETVLKLAAVVTVGYSISKGYSAKGILTGQWLGGRRGLQTDYALVSIHTALDVDRQVSFK